MGRRRAAEKREVLPDPKFGSIVVTKLPPISVVKVTTYKNTPQL